MIDPDRSVSTLVNQFQSLYELGISFEDEGNDEDKDVLRIGTRRRAAVSARWCEASSVTLYVGRRSKAGSEDQSLLKRDRSRYVRY